MIDLKNSIKVVNAVAPYNPAATGTTSGVVVDLANYGSATLMLHAGIQTTASATPTLVVLHGTTSTTFTSAADTDLIGTEAAATAKVTGAITVGAVGTIGYVGANRYVKARINLAGAATGYYSAAWILGNPRKAPKTQ